MVDWVVDALNAKFQIPTYVILLFISVGAALLKACGWIIGFLHRRRMNRHLDAHTREAREWAIGEISFLASDGKSGFIDPRSGHRNVRFEKAALRDTTVILGQRVRFLADWSKTQPLAKSVQALPKVAVKALYSSVSNGS